MPGTHVGNFDRGINAGNINAAISNYNATVAGQPTPAGKVLIQNGLMTAAQLVALGGVAPTVPLAPPDQVNLAWLRTMDMTLAWTLHHQRAADHQTVSRFLQYLQLRQL